MSTRSALDLYEARIAMARVRYRQAYDESASLPEFQRSAAEAIAFMTLQSIQQDAMRVLIASEFAELLALRERLSTQDPKSRPETRKGTRVE